MLTGFLDERTIDWAEKDRPFLDAAVESFEIADSERSIWMTYSWLDLLRAAEVGEIGP
jgi:hypothetical protein